MSEKDTKKQPSKGTAKQPSNMDDLGEATLNPGGPAAKGKDLPKG